MNNRLIPNLPLEIEIGQGDTFDTGIFDPP
jgi:hypothetical protein